MSARKNPGRHLVVGAGAATSLLSYFGADRNRAGGIGPACARAYLAGTLTVTNTNDSGAGSAARRDQHQHSRQHDQCDRGPDRNDNPPQQSAAGERCDDRPVGGQRRHRRGVRCVFHDRQFVARTQRPPTPIARRDGADGAGPSRSTAPPAIRRPSRSSRCRPGRCSTPPRRRRREQRPARPSPRSREPARSTSTGQAAGNWSRPCTATTTSRTRIFSGSITGTGGEFALFGGGGKLTWTGTSNTYSGPTDIFGSITEGTPGTGALGATLAAGAANVFSPNSAVVMGGPTSTLALNSFNQTIASLAGNGVVNLGSALLTLGGDGTPVRPSPAASPAPAAASTRSALAPSRSTKPAAPPIAGRP